MLAIYLTPLILMLTGVVTNLWLVFACWAVMGVGMSGIGMSVMHDAIHGAYSSSGQINKYVGYTMNFIGANASVWKVQHNVLHHTYTNIQGSDEDINSPFFLRFSPHTKRLWIHRFQHIYVWFFYCFLTLLWIVTTDYAQLYRYYKSGHIGTKAQFAKDFSKLIAWKVFYFGYVIVLPLIFLPFSPWVTIVGFVIMHAVAGFLLSIVFQAAHVMPSCEFPLPNEKGMVENNWAVHQLETTTNFAPNNWILNWFIGGLNYQVEHHLFTHICHIHYPKISKIVSETAKEFGVRYQSQKSFMSAMWQHAKLLKDLGRMELKTQ